MSLFSIPAYPVREKVSRELSPSSLTTFSEIDAASKQRAYIEANTLDSAKRKRNDRMGPHNPGLDEIDRNTASTQPRYLEKVGHSRND